MYGLKSELFIMYVCVLLLDLPAPVTTFKVGMVLYCGNWRSVSRWYQQTLARVYVPVGYP